MHSWIFYFLIHFQTVATSIGVSLAVGVESAFTFAPMRRPGRKYMCSEHHLFLTGLNVVTGSSNQPWALTPTFFFYTSFYSVQPTGTVRCKCCFYFFTCFVEIVTEAFNSVKNVKKVRVTNKMSHHECMQQPHHFRR